MQARPLVRVGIAQAYSQQRCELDQERRQAKGHPDVPQGGNVPLVHDKPGCVQTPKKVEQDVCHVDIREEHGNPRD